MFFALKPKRSILSDVNADLINAYEAIRDDWRLVRRYLGEYAATHNKSQYYRERSKKSTSRYRNAARFIYLNRVCWNGLYRVNLKGQFNVPLGTKTQVILDTDNFAAIADTLEGAELISSDFEAAIDRAKNGDLVFVDPPYITAHNRNGFIKYNEKIFGWNDQIRLRNAIARAKNRGAYILISNADHASIRDLYSDIGTIKSIGRASVIAAASEYRQSTTELLIQTYA